MKSDVLKIIIEILNGKIRFDKFVLVVLDENEKLIGLVDIVFDYLWKGCWFIGLFFLMLDVCYNGFGKVFY